MNNIILKIFGLSILSSVLLSIPFLLPGTGIVALFAFVPLLAAEYLATEHKFRYFFSIYYLAFLLWNCATTYWIYLATIPGAIAAVVLNSLQMAIVFALFRWIKRLTKGYLPYLFLIVVWIAWEHSYFDWNISWPWLVLGNSFSTSIILVQWYEYTGALGGSLWILLCNTLLFRIFILKFDKYRIKASVISYALIFVLPIIISAIIYYSYDLRDKDNNTKRVTFSVLQPNIDPYNDKFGGLSQTQQTNILLNLAQDAVDDGNTGIKSNKNYVLLAPETFLSLSYESNSIVNEDYPLLTRSLFTIDNFVHNLNKLSDSLKGCRYEMILGAETNKIYSSPVKTDKNGAPIPPTETARPLMGGYWSDTFNSAIYISDRGTYDFYHKSKLVILVESTPFKGWAKPLKKLAVNLGGSFGGFGTQPERDVFNLKDSVKIGTAICYESIYGDYYRDYILKGANIMSIITNDGWWGNTPGYKQHLSYASLRAIETRRSIARCANTGISAFINERGNIISKSSWWSSCYLNGSLPVNDRITFFVSYGDIIGRISCFLLLLFVLMGIVKQISRRYVIRGGE